MTRIKNNHEKLLRSYDRADRKHSGKWARQQRSRTHSRSKARKRAS